MYDDNSSSLVRFVVLSSCELQNKRSVCVSYAALGTCVRAGTAQGVRSNGKHTQRGRERESRIDRDRARSAAKTPTSEEWQRCGLILGDDGRRPEQDDTHRVVECGVRRHTDDRRFLRRRPDALVPDVVERAEQEERAHHERGQMAQLAVRPKTMPVRGRDGRNIEKMGA